MTFIGSNSVYKSRLQLLRRKIGKKFEDFTVDDWLTLLDLHEKTSSRYDCGSLFGAGGDECSDWSIVEIDGKQYLEYYCEC